MNGETTGASRFVSASADGRYVAFMSAASNLVANDTNDVADVFVKDRHGPPIVAERATYWNVTRSSGGQVSVLQQWGGGEAVPLTKIAPLPQ